MASTTAMPTEVIDNLKEGDELDLGSSLFYLFEDQLKKKYLKPAVKRKTHSHKKGEASDH